MSGESSSAVQIHLNFQQDADQVHVDFQFDTEKDDLDSVVNDLISTIGIGPEQIPVVKAKISEQIRNAIRNAQENYKDHPPSANISVPSSPNTNSQTESSSNQSQVQQQNTNDENPEILNDPEYVQLLKQQQQELKEMEARHISEQQSLALKLSTGTADDDLLIF